MGTTWLGFSSGSSDEGSKLSVILVAATGTTQLTLILYFSCGQERNVDSNTHTYTTAIKCYEKALLTYRNNDPILPLR